MSGWPALPAFWDGRPLEWTRWSFGPELHLCGTNIEPEYCDVCGAITRHVHATGRPPGDDYLTHRATRCPHCGHTRVTTRGETWDLGPEDYGPEGSTNPNTHRKDTP